MGILRTLLAISVLIAHSLPLLGSRLAADVSVEGFFIISGFYMALILNGKYSDKSTLLFFSNRALRLYPTYLAILLFVLFSNTARWHIRGEASRSLAVWLQLFSDMNWSSILILAITNLTFFGTDALVYYKISSQTGFFSLHGDLPANGSALDLQFIRQTWSLGVEVVFYIMAPALCRLRLIFILPIYFIAVALRYYWFGWDAHPMDWSQTFFLFRLPLFILGIIAYHWSLFVQKKSWIFKPLPTLSVVGIVLLSIAYEPLHMPPFIYYFSIAALTPFLLEFSNQHKWDRFIGDLSYSYYLLHWVILQYTWQIINYVPHWSFTLISSIIVLAAATLVWFCIERPINLYRQSRVLHASAKS